MQLPHRLWVPSPCITTPFCTVVKYTVKKPVRVTARSGKTSGKDRQFPYSYPHTRADDSTSTLTLIHGDGWIRGLGTRAWLWNGVTWHKCCHRACQLLNSLGIKRLKLFKTIANWNKVCRKFECFPHPNPYVQCGKHPLPRLLKLHLNAKDQIASLGIKNLGFIITSILPRLTSTCQKEQCSESASFSVTRTATPDDNSTINSFLNAAVSEKRGH
jgi:hypothetical protein